MLEGRDLYSIMTIMIIHDIAVITGVIHCWTGCAKEGIKTVQAFVSQGLSLKLPCKLNVQIFNN